MQNILITGCSSGIGLQTALTFKKRIITKVYASAKKIEDVEMLRNLGFPNLLKLMLENKEDISNAFKYYFTK